MLDERSKPTSAAPLLHQASLEPGSPQGVGSLAAGRAPYESQFTTTSTSALHVPHFLDPPTDPSRLSALPPLLPGGAARGMLGSGSARDGGRVMVHWTQSGPPTVQASERAPPSPDMDEDPDDEDDELLTPSQPRERLSYTRYQLELLNGIYVAVRYPNSVQKQLIARRVGISREQVKIWFQNRRRKDVVQNKSTPTAGTDNVTHSPSQHNGSSPKSRDTSDNSQDGSNDAVGSGEGQKDTGGGKSKMVPETIINGCIAELNRFTDEKLKERKEKRKAKGKRRGQHSSASTSVTRSSATNGACPTQQGGVCPQPGGASMGGVSIGASSALPPLPPPPLPPTLGGRLFQAYDMIAPPNKVTPTAAYLNTTANRFSHSHNSSAFSSPRHYMSNSTLLPRLAWDSTDPTGLGSTVSALGGGASGLSMSVGGVADSLTHPRPYGGLGMSGLGMGLLPNMSQPQSVGGGLMGGAQDSLPVLSELLGYRQSFMDIPSPSSVSTVSSTSSTRGETVSGAFQQSSLLGSDASPRSVGDFGKMSESLLPPAPSHTSFPTPPSPFSLGRVYPYPFIADPPMLLSSLHQHTDPLLATSHWPHPSMAPPSSSMFGSMGAMNGMDPYKPVVISSFSNPFFSSHAAPPHPSSNWPPPPQPHPQGGETAPGGGFSH